MPKITMTESKAIPVLPEDAIIQVRVAEINVEEKEGKWGPWEVMSVKFDIVRAFDPALTKAIETAEWIWGSVKFDLTDDPENELRQWIEALLDVDQLGLGFVLDTDLLIGREARAIVANYTKKDGTVRHKVGALIPLGNATAGAPAQAAPAPAPAPAPAAPVYEDLPF